MPERLFMTRLFFMTGGLLLVIGLMLWFTLPIPSMAPPYLVTALLALGYGVYCWQSGRPRRAEKS
jgi:hypothetical protein